ncbi:hypothetical protein [Clostridium sp.]|nr:hypothetical protein [Clostridium sp.]
MFIFRKLYYDTEIGGEMGGEAWWEGRGGWVWRTILFANIDRKILKNFKV